MFVNHLWQLYFGTGLVKTAEDFGLQGERPSHPELLDWLAVECIESGWNVKHLVKLIVLSSTYRQSSQVDESSLASDPENRLLSRGARFRLPAWMLRDAALRASGLLHPVFGGPRSNLINPWASGKRISWDDSLTYPAKDRPVSPDSVCVLETQYRAHFPF